MSGHYTFFNEEMETLPKRKLQALQLQRTFANSLSLRRKQYGLPTPMAQP